MKKILNTLVMALIVLMSSCDNDFAYPPVIMGDIKGDGTAESPYNIAKAVREAAKNGETSDQFVFVEGYVVSGSIDTSYGNATWDLYDNIDGTGQKLIAYRIKGFNNLKFTNADQVKIGDKVVLYTPLINFRGNTPETGTGGYLYAVNGVVGSNPVEPTTPSNPGTPEGNGTVDSPYNVAKAIEVAKANGETSETSVYTMGYVISGSIDTGYGNGTWEINDNADGSGAKITVYRAKDFNNEKFTDANKVKVGDKIVVYAPLINFKGNTPETNLGYLYSINGQTSGGTTPDTPNNPDTPAGAQGDGTEASPYNVAAVIGGATGTDKWVKGYIVGWIDGMTLSDGAKFNGTATASTNLMIADSPNANEVSAVVPVQLPSGAVRAALNLVDNPGNYKKEVMLKGSLEKYFGAAGIKSVTEYKIDGASTPDTPDTPVGDYVYSGLTWGIDGWTINNVVMPEALTYIWNWDSSYKCLKASAYVNNTNYATDAYITTKVDLTGCSAPKASFEHAYKFGNKSDLSCVARVEGTTDWTVLAIPTWGTGNDWTFVNSGDIDLKAFAGKKIEIGFRYTSTSSSGATWEIKNFNISK